MITKRQKQAYDYRLSGLSWKEIAEKMDIGTERARKLVKLAESGMLKSCPICGSEMRLLHGCYWDYDRWCCFRKIDRFRFCPGEIELPGSSFPEGWKEEES